MKGTTMASTTLFLQLNARGPEVKALHASLGKLGFKIPKAELDEQRFGTGTLAALLSLQRKLHLPLTGVADERTAAALESAVADATSNLYRVEGRIFFDYGLPAGNLTIRLYNRAFGAAAPALLKEGATDDQGLYAIDYD